MFLNRLSSGAGNQAPEPARENGGGGGAGAAHFLHASAHTSIELRWPPLTPLAEHFPSDGASLKRVLPLDSDYLNITRD